MGKADLEDVLAIAERSIGDSWSREQFVAELTITGGIQLVAVGGNKRARGYAIFRKAADEAELLQLAVQPEYRRRKIASVLLAAAMRELAGQTVRYCFLEVRANNQTARNFYTAAGFREIGLRRKYYSHPVDDAVLMKRAV